MSSQAFQIAGRTGDMDSVHVLQVTGEITHYTSPTFVEAVRAVATPNLIIDLSDVPYIDSLAVGALVRSYVFCNKAHRQLALVGLNQRILNILKITGVDSLFDVYPRISDAEAQWFSNR